MHLKKRKKRKALFVSPEVHAKVKKAADKNNRKMSQEVEVRFSK